MKAYELTSWDKCELANNLAEQFADAEDLLEAFPGIERISSIEEELMTEYIAQNWKDILPRIDEEELFWWLEDKNAIERQNQWKDEQIEEEVELQEYYEEEYYWDFITKMDQFRYKDLAERWGHPPKWRKS